MPRVTRKTAGKNYPAQGIKKGEVYYSWKFYRGRKVMSKTPPKPSQLTQRADYGALRRAQEIVNDIDWTEEKWKEDRASLAAEVDDAIQALTEARDASQEKYDNMPEQWQGADMGQNAEGFCSECDDAISELETIKDGLDDTSSLEFEELDDPTQISWPNEY
jgi:hypothetical protein